jgi:site-specific DNA recombinase
MTAAIYARKSTEQSGIADEQKSVARQVEHARAYAQRKGWTVDDEHVYVDDGISGAEFANRPGFLRLMNTLKPRAPFQVLIMSEESRLGREAIETAYTLKQLVTAGVRVFFYLEDRERTLDSPTDKIMLSLTAFADELEREKARQRTYDAMLRKARAGHVTGGACFGYDNVRTDAGVTIRAINEREASVVRRIFERCAAGDGLKGITKLLNDERAAAPRSQRGRPQAWAPSSVREILYRECYRGVLVWNKSQKRDRWGRKHQHDRPSTEWLKVPANELRIVSDALWNAAHEQLSRRRENYRVWTRTDARRSLEPRGVRQSYLLSGFGRCGCCGGSVQVISRASTTGRLFRYGCGQYAGRGVAVCGNARLARLDQVDAGIRELLATEVLQPKIVELALDKAIAMLRAPAQSNANRVQATKRLRELETTLRNLTDTAARGGAVPAVLKALNEADAERRIVESQLTAMKTSRTANTVGDVHELRRTLRGYLDEWHALIGGNVAEARGLLQLLLRERIVFTPIAGDDGRPMYELQIPIAFERLLVAVVPGLQARVGLASPTGFEPVFWP